MSCEVDGAGERPELDDEQSVVTSVRVPSGLRRAARALQEAGLITSWNDLLVRGARDRLDAIAHRAGLEAHYSDYPHVRPALADVAAALAVLDGVELAGRRDLIDQAARELSAIRSGSDADDVLTYATALLRHEVV